MLISISPWCVARQPTVKAGEDLCCLGSGLLHKGWPAHSGEDPCADIGNESSLAAHQCGRHAPRLNVVRFGAPLVGEKAGEYLRVTGDEFPLSDLQGGAGV